MSNYCAYNLCIYYTDYKHITFSLKYIISYEIINYYFIVFFNDIYKGQKLKFQGYIVHTPLRMISLSLKSKEVQSKFNKSEEMPAYRHLLLLLVKLIHADPMVMLSVSILDILYIHIHT